MTRPTADRDAPARRELAAILGPMLIRQLGESARIARLDARPSAYRTSFPLDEVDVTLEDGRRLELVRKDVGAQALQEGEGRIKPGFVYDPLREVEVYRRVLTPLRERLGTATFYGAVTDPAAGRYWLFLERVPGVELYQVGDVETWKHVARWLARLHIETAPLAAPAMARAARLLRYDGDYLNRWAQRARSFLMARNLAPESRRDVDRLVGGYHFLADRLAALPATVIHGEFYASNILVGESGGGLRVCPVDWEMAAAGPGLMDLAALVAGRWTEAQRREIALAYRAALTAGEPARVAADDEASFLEDLDRCRLHLAVQWLGWATDWSPPPEHAQDWLAVALGLARRPGLTRPATRRS